MIASSADPERPYVVVLGGAKVSDKLGVIRALLPKVDVMLVGGAMCFTLLAAEGYEVGDSLVEADMVDDVARCARLVRAGPGSHCPWTWSWRAAFAADTPHRVEPATDLPPGTMGLDIGPETAERFASIIAGADTIFWNGPMGVFEWPAFAAGTRAVAEAVAASRGLLGGRGGRQRGGAAAMGLDGGGVAPLHRRRGRSGTDRAGHAARYRRC